MKEVLKQQMCKMISDGNAIVLIPGSVMVGMQLASKTKARRVSACKSVPSEFNKDEARERSHNASSFSPFIPFSLLLIPL